MADFRGSAFHQKARFGHTVFRVDCKFRGVKFNSASSFESAQFQETVDFSECSFESTASFNRGQFGSGVSFKRAVFSELADFSECEFKGSADFKRVQFKAGVDFRAATFEKPVSFRRIEWPESSYQWHGAFNSTLFRGAVTFAGAGCQSFAAFDGATFERAVYVDEMPERDTERQFAAELNGALDAAKTDADEFEIEQKGLLAIEKKQVDKASMDALVADKKRDYLQRSRVNRLHELEGGCRTLRRAMESAGNRRREQLFYRLELRARRAQKTLPRGERFFSWLYDAFSSYGASMTAPLWSLAIMILAFAAIYGIGAKELAGLRAVAEICPGFAVTCDGRWQFSPGFWANSTESLIFSLKNAFLPFSALAAEKPLSGRETFGTALLFEYGSGIGLAVRVLGTLQSLLALTFAFLFALALRRRFQIS